MSLAYMSPPLAAGLLPKHPGMNPDSFREDPSGRSKGLVYQYHGVVHGWLPGHPKHETYTPLGKWGPTAYAETLEKDRRYIDEKDTSSLKTVNGLAALGTC
eukprot:5275346-Prymnesium_polylepis.1